MATDIARLTVGMRLLEPAFQPAAAPATVIGRLRTSGQPEIEAAIDAALHAAGVEIVTIDWDGLDRGGQAFMGIFFDEIWSTDHDLVEAHPDDVGGDITQAITFAAELRQTATAARQAQRVLRQSLAELFDRVQLLALPTLPIFPPLIRELTPDSLFPICVDITRHVAAFNVAGAPATAQPVPVPGSHLPASLQLVGPMFGEELLMATAASIEAAVRTTS